MYNCICTRLTHEKKSPPSEHPGRAQSKLSDVSSRPMQHTLFMAIQIIMQSPRAVPGS